MKLQHLLRFSFCAFLAIGSILSLLFSNLPAVANHWLSQGLPQESGLDPDNQTDNLGGEYTPLTLAETEFRRLASRGSTSSRGRAGSRSNCPSLNAGEPNLTAIVPLIQGTVDGIPVETAVGTTTSAYPTFWFYVPYPAEKIHSVRFVVNNEQDIPLFEPVTVPLTNRVPGLVSVQLPESASPLEVGKYYRWYVMLYCSSEGGSDTFADAYVQRVELSPETASKLATASPHERIDLLLANNAWHEAVGELYTLQMQLPSDTGIRVKWVELLEIGGLSSQLLN